MLKATPSLSRAMKSPPSSTNVVLLDTAVGSSMSGLLSTALMSCVDPDMYSLQVVSIDKCLRIPWKSNAVCLVVCNWKSVQHRHWLEIYDFFRCKGAVVVFYPGILKASAIKDCAFFEDGFSFKWEAADHSQSEMCGINGVQDSFRVRRLDEVNGLLYTLVDRTSGRAVFIDADIRLEPNLTECFKIALPNVGISLRSSDYEVPKRTVGVMYGVQADSEQVAQYFLDLGALKSFKYTLTFQQMTDSVPEPTGDKLPIVLADLSEQGLPPEMENGFHRDTYFKHIKTSRLGTILIHVPVLDSTMDTMQGCRSLEEYMGRMVVVADIQRAGVGRGPNQWISPVGSASFTFYIYRKTYTELVRRSSWLQHMVAMSVVEGICTLPGYEETQLKIKWPNDILTTDGIKVGGVLVKGYCSTTDFVFTIGCGVNVANEKPTRCVNDVIPEDVQPLEPAQVIALALNRMETFVQMLEEGRVHELRNLYRKYWIHEEQEVTLADTNRKGIVMNLDEHGYLLVRQNNNEWISLQPDSNSFDMTANMIISKH